MAKDLVTKAEYKAYANITSTNFDAEIGSIIPKVSQLVKSYCRQSFVDNVDDPKVEHFVGGNVYYLKEHPVIAVQGVYQSKDYGKNYTALVEYTDWVFSSEDYGIHAINGELPKAVNGHKVVYTCGYEVLPEDLKVAVLDLVTYYRKNDASVHSTKAPGTNSVQIEYISTTTLPAHIRRILDLYVADYT